MLKNVYNNTRLSEMSRDVLKYSVSNLKSIHKLGTCVNCCYQYDVKKIKLHFKILHLILISEFFYFENVK